MRGEIFSQSRALVIRDHDVATPALLCHKEPALKAPKSPFYPRHGGYFLPFTGSLWHKGAYYRFFPCMEATYHVLDLGASKVQPIRAQYLEDLDQ